MKLIDIIDATPIRYGYRIAFLTNFFREPLLRRMEQEFGIIRPEWTVLLCLEFQNNLAQKDICEITEQPSNTVSRAVRSLEHKGYIKCGVDATDARRTVLEITSSGRKLHQQIMPMFVEGEAAMLAPLTNAELARLDKLLDKLCRAVPDWHQSS